MFPLFWQAFVSGLVWFPFALALGLTYRHLRAIDVSIDGVAVIAGIVAATVWNETDSFTLSIIAAAVSGIIGGLAIGTLVYVWRIQPLLAGVLLSLVLHSLSVALVGESTVLRDRVGVRVTTGNFVPHLLLMSISLAVLTTLFYRTNVGVLVRALGSNPTIASPLPPSAVLTGAMAFSGAIVGVGAGMYVHVEGVARAGGGFDFLLTGLTSFLVPDRFFKAARTLLQRWRGDGILARLLTPVLTALKSVGVLALIGACLFQVLIYSVIRWSPRPDLWKLFLACCLTGTLGAPRIRKLRRWLEFFFVAERRTPASAHHHARLTVRGLTKRFVDVHPHKDVFTDVSFTCKRGLVVLAGANGAGKSTLLRCIAGDLSLDAGTITLGPRVLDTLPPYERPLIYLRQQSHANLAPNLSLMENLIWIQAGREPLLWISSGSRVAARLYTAVPDADRILPSGSLATLARELSGGEAQCVSIMMALLSRRHLLLADEPTAALDYQNREAVCKLLKRAAASAIVVVATHDPALVSEADAVLEIANGTIHQAANKAGIIEVTA